MSATPSHIKFDKIDGFIRVYDGSRYILLFGDEKYELIYDRIRYLIEVKRGITYAFSHDYSKIKVYSHDYLPLEKNRLFMLQYSSSQFLINIKITITIINFQKNAHIHNINTLYYNRTHISEGIHVN